MGFVRNLTLIVCLLPWLMGAAVYRWVDEDGVVNYTQLKPEGVDAELVSADTGQRVESPRQGREPSSTGPAITGNGEQPLTEEQQQMLSDLQAAEQARQEEIARVREANCEQARDMLERLTARGRVRVVGDDGVERVMPEEERQRRIDEAQRAVAINCTDTASR